LAELVPEVLARGHDRVIVLDDIVDGERADPKPVGLKQLRDLEVSRQERHGDLLAPRRSSRISPNEATVIERVSFLGEEPWMRAGHVRCQPLAMRKGHHPVLAALPHDHRHADAVQVKAPRPGEGQVVMEPTPDASRDGLPEGCRQVGGEVTGDRADVDRRDQIAKRCRTCSPVTPANTRAWRSR
jgi:hypothetical protein